jgi:hypothetical protein
MEDMGVAALPSSAGPSRFLGEVDEGVRCPDVYDRFNKWEVDPGGEARGGDHDTGLALTEVVGDLRLVVNIHFGVMCGRVRDAVRHELDHGDGIAENHDLTLVRKLAVDIGDVEATLVKDVVHLDVVVGDGV